MKTNMIKTATLILAVVISTSVNAQNTKSFKENRAVTKLNKFVKENITSINNELKNLKASVQYKPEANFTYANEVAETSVVVDLGELESITKFTPSTIVETTNFQSDNELANILEELKKDIQYQPVADISENKSLVEEITKELASIVRYTPAS